MATITKRKVKEHVYYYFVQGKRIDGKSRLVKQQYLGGRNRSSPDWRSRRWNPPVCG